MRKLFITDDIHMPGKNKHSFNYKYEFNFKWLALVLVLAVIAYGLFVSPCSISFEGKVTGRMDAENPWVSNANLVLTSAEGKFSATAPCLVVLSQGFNIKQTTNEAPVVKPKVISYNEQIPMGAQS